MTQPVLSRRSPLEQRIELRESDDPVLRRARSAFAEHYQAARALAAGKGDLLRSYDLAGMNRAVAICHWGRSGSLLLASYFDGHPDTVMLPHGTSENIYPFLIEHGTLSLWEKLVVYPTYSAARTGAFGNLFLKDNPEGDFAIEAADYYAAVLAAFEALGARSSAELDGRITFFRLLHVVYTIATGRPLAHPRPLMVYSQHWFDQRLAEAFVEDFPRGQFIHTIRDPISALDSWFEWKVGSEMYRKSADGVSSQYADPAVGANLDLLARDWDRSHRGMEARTRAVRFEDMHLAPEATLRRLADWLGISFEACLLQSTWNGRPYVVTAGGSSWSGANPKNARRRSRNLSGLDRLRMFALLHEHFLRWRYPFPDVFRKRWMRMSVIALLWLVPMKMELRAARVVLQWQAIPSLRRGRIGFALRAPAFLLGRRFAMMRLILSRARSRPQAQRPLLELL